MYCLIKTLILRGDVQPVLGPFVGRLRPRDINFPGGVADSLFGPFQRSFGPFQVDFFGSDGALTGLAFGSNCNPSCSANSADVAAAARLGATRVVLAREVALAEIRDASAVAGIETEVFVQGALCFSVSGRCMLSSWVGGRSGNRGTCTSTCRVPWMVEGGPVGTPLSMKDLSLVQRLDELAEFRDSLFDPKPVEVRAPAIVADPSRIHLLRTPGRATGDNGAARLALAMAQADAELKDVGRGEGRSGEGDGCRGQQGEDRAHDGRFLAVDR